MHHNYLPLKNKNDQKHGAIGRMTLCYNMKRSSIIKFVKYKRQRIKQLHNILSFAERGEEMMTYSYVLIYV